MVVNRIELWVTSADAAGDVTRWHHPDPYPANPVFSMYMVGEDGLSEWIADFASPAHCRRCGQALAEHYQCPLFSIGGGGDDAESTHR